MREWTRFSSEEPTLALTFDDGPHRQHTSRLARLLEAHDARGTFFVLGRQAWRQARLLRALVKAGHQLGNHSFWHSTRSLSLPGVADLEIAITDWCLRLCGAKVPIPFRAPFGILPRAAASALARAGRDHFLFDTAPSPPDYENPPPEQLAESLLTRAQPGSIVVLHDGGTRGGGDRRAMIAALAIALPQWRRQGWRLVTLRELIASQAN